MAQQDLTGRRRGFHGGHGRRVLAGDEQLALPAPGEHEQEHAAVHPHRDAQHDAAARGHHRTALFQRGAHSVGRPTRPFSMKVAIEEQEQRVAAELDEIAAFGSSDAQECVEGVVEDDRELLGTRSAELGELLGQPGETGDVGEDHCPGRLPHPLIWHAE